MCLKKNVSLPHKTVLITGAAGFIGANLVLQLIRMGEPVTIVGFDNLNDYYDVSLKEYRLREIEAAAAVNPLVTWIFVRGNLADKAAVEHLFESYRFQVVVNLAAQAGVRYSIDHPDVYMESNIIGFFISWRPAATGLWSIWCMHPAPASTAPMKRSPIPPKTGWTIQ